MKTKKKRQQSKTGKGHRVVNKVVSVDSFFKFFTPPYAADEDMTEEMAEKMQADYSAGCCFTDRLIPRGVAWFTGEAAASYLGLVCKPPSLSINYTLGEGEFLSTLRLGF